MAIPDYQSLMLPVLRFAAKGATSVKAAEQALASELALTEAERVALLPSGKQRVFNNRIHWAKSYLQKAGLLASPKRGWFAITPEGEAVLATAPAKIDNTFLKQFPVFVSFLSGQSMGQGGQEPLPANAGVATPEELIDQAYQSLDLALRAELIERILQKEPDFFEQLIVNLLVAIGYGGSHDDAAAKLGKSGDGGVDGVINQDLLGLERVYVQAKRYALDIPIGRPALQAFVGSLVGFGASKGVFVTTSSFTAQAVGYVDQVPQRVALIDGQRLAQLLIRYKVGVRTGRTIELKELDENYFADEE